MEDKSGRYLLRLSNQRTTMTEIVNALPAQYIEPPIVKQFKNIERKELPVLNHSGMMVYKECPKKYFFQIVLAYKPKGQLSTPIIFGSAYHKFREILQKTSDAGQAAQAGFAIWNKQQGSDPEPKTRYEFLTKIRLTQSFAAGAQKWMQDSANAGIQTLGVEMPFALELSEGEYTSGRLDKFIRLRGQLYVVDYKTTTKEGAYFARRLHPNDQFVRYMIALEKLAGERVGGVIVEVLYNTKKVGPVITPYVESFSRWEIEEWLKSELEWRQRIQRSRETDTWPANEAHCSFCDFHSVCKHNSESSQASALNLYFVQRVWDTTAPDAE